ncbi:hypothetical protein HMPREF1870_01682 [Bacteroidales bacterium KA00344]|nr:hypothetical protein HMPREF1870_01682 [Bacteroidales bacterium KA00344]
MLFNMLSCYHPTPQRRIYRRMMKPPFLQPSMIKTSSTDGQKGVFA